MPDRGDLGTAIESAFEEPFKLSSGRAVNRTLTLAPGLYSVTAPLVIPPALSLQISEGTLIRVAAGQILTIQGSFSGGSYQIFSGPGLVSFRGNSRITSVNAKWWGATGDGATDDTSSLQSALESSVTADNRLAFFIPASTYRVCNLFLGKKIEPCPTGVECSAPARVFGEGGVSVFSTKLKATDSCGSKEDDFVVIANTMSSFTLENLAIDGNGTSTAGTGASCLDASWKWFRAPATKNIFRDLDLEGCKDAAGAYGFNANQLNDAAFETIYIGFRSRKPTGHAVAFSLLAGGGQAGTISNFKIYGSAPMQIDIQNGQLQDSYLTGGLIIGFSGKTGGVSSNHVVLNNVQIDQNPATGIVIQGLKTRNSGAAIQDLTCNACTLSTIGLSPGQAIFSGVWLAGASMNGGQINVGLGSVFGPDYGAGSGTKPVFFFRGTSLNGSLPQAASNRDVVLEGSFDGKTGEVISSSSVAISAVNNAHGSQGYFASTGTAPGGIVIDNKAGGQQSQVAFEDGGALKYALGKGTSNYWYLYDAVRQRNVLTVDAKQGTLVLGTAVASGDTPPAITAGPGAGPSAVAAVVGHTNAGKITVTTGSAPKALAKVAAVSFSSNLSTDAYCGILPANAAAANLRAGVAPYISNTSFTGFTVTSAAEPLAPDTEYSWTYLCF